MSGAKGSAQLERAVTRQLVEAARAGDHEAFEALAVSSVDRLYGIARLILRDQHQAEDAVQECIVRAWRDLPKLRDADRFDAWLHRLLVNACADEGRGVRRFQSQVRLLRVEPSMGDQTSRVADQDQLERAFRALKPSHRAIVVLHHYLGLDTAELAATLGVPPGTVKSRLHYAMQALRAALDSDARTAITPKGRTA